MTLFSIMFKFLSHFLCIYALWLSSLRLANEPSSHIIQAMSQTVAFTTVSPRMSKSTPESLKGSIPDPHRPQTPWMSALLVSKARYFEDLISLFRPLSTQCEVGTPHAQGDTPARGRVCRQTTSLPLLPNSL